MISTKTKKYQQDVNQFVQLGLMLVFKKWWYAFLVPIAMIVTGIVFGGATLWWMLGLSVLVTILYALFWGAQFYGLSQLPQGKPWFEKYHYEFHNKSLLVKKSEREGMELSWDKFQKVSKNKSGFIFHMSAVQFIFLPFSVFSSENDIKFVELLLRRKNLMQ